MNSIKVLITVKAFDHIKYGTGFIAKNGITIMFRSRVGIIGKTLFINNYFRGNEQILTGGFEVLEIAEAIHEINNKFYEHKQAVHSKNIIIRRNTISYIKESINRTISHRQLRNTFKN